jgi:hypothetical protein
MADTARTRAALLTLYADNTTGQISSQDFRDGVVSWMPSEFAFVGDFWKQPLPSQIVSTDLESRGWIDYSQIAGSALSFGNAVIFLSNEWTLADVADSGLNPAMGLALGSYASNDSNVQILRRGIIFNSAYSVRFSDAIGRPIYLQSGDAGSISVTITTNSVAVLGFVERQSDGGTSNIIRFDPDGWAVKGS